MQHGLDLIRHESVTYVPWQARHGHHPVRRMRHHRKTLFAEFTGKVAREIGACKVQERAGLLQLFRLRTRQHQIAQRAGIAR